MKNDILMVYTDLSKLLVDISQFLKDESEHGRLSPKSKSIATSLIKRSQLSLKDIARVAPDNDSGRYVDMKGTICTLEPEYLDPISKQKLEDGPPIYTDIGNEKELNTTKPVSTNECPYINFPAHSVPYENKTGFLERKEKLLIFMEQKRKMYAGIHNRWILLYTNENEIKPFEYHDLSTCTANHVEKKDLCFELNIANGYRIIQFIASTKKDAIQWVKELNKAGPEYDKPVIRHIEYKKMPELDAETMEVYAQLQEEDTYNEIDESNEAVESNTLPLPPKQSLKMNPLLRPVPSLPDLNAASKEDEAEDDTYDFIDNTKAAEPKWNPRLRPVPSLPNSKLSEDINVSDVLSEDDEEYDLIATDIASNIRPPLRNEVTAKVIEVIEGQPEAGAQVEAEEIYDVISSPPIPKSEPIFENKRRSKLISDLDDIPPNVNRDAKSKRITKSERKLVREVYVINENDEDNYDVLTTNLNQSGSEISRKSKVIKDEEELYDILTTPSVGGSVERRHSYLHGTSSPSIQATIPEEDDINNLVTSAAKPPVPLLKPKLNFKEKPKITSTFVANDDVQKSSFIFKYKK